MQTQPQNGMEQPRWNEPVFGKRRSRILTLALLLLLLFSALSLGRSFEPPVSSRTAVLPPAKSLNSSTTSTTKQLRFMTFNIRHAKGLDGQIRLAAIRDQIVRGQADFIALQEVDRYQWRTGLQDQARALAGMLGMPYIFAPAMKQGLSEYGVALLSRYPIKQYHIDPLPGGQEPRVALTVEAVTSSGSVLTVVTTHLGVPHADREQQLPALIRIVKSIRTPVVVMGDFNMKDNDPLMKDFHTLTSLHKVPLSTPQATVLDGGEIDHLFTSFTDKTAAWTESTSASDHVPVVGSFLIR